MRAVFKRELISYFVTPVGYVYLGAFFALAGYSFSTAILNGSADFSSEFVFLYTVTILLTPILTMRLFSEEKKQKTDKLLFSAPVSLYGIAAGKLFAAAAVYCLGLISAVLQALALSAFAKVNTALVFGNLLGLALTGTACIALGMFVSSLTENQITAAIGTFAAMVLIISVGPLAGLFGEGVLQTVLRGLSFYEKYYQLTIGILGVSDVFFFLCFTGVFWFLTVRVLDRRRWAGK